MFRIKITICVPQSFHSLTATKALFSACLTRVEIEKNCIYLCRKYGTFGAKRMKINNSRVFLLFFCVINCCTNISIIYSNRKVCFVREKIVQINQLTKFYKTCCDAFKSVRFSWVVLVIELYWTCQFELWFKVHFYIEWGIFDEPDVMIVWGIASLV